MRLIRYKLRIIYFSEAERDDMSYEKAFNSYRAAKKACRAFEEKNLGVVSHAEITPVLITEII